MTKTLVCACGIKCKVHSRKSRRKQLPGLATDRFGRSVKHKKKRRAKYRRTKFDIFKPYE